MCSAKKVAALQAKEEVGKSEVFDCRFCLLIQTVCTNWWVSLVYSWQNFVLYGVKDSSTSQKILWFLKFSDWHGMCNACFFSEKEQVVQLCNIQHPYIYTTTLDGALAQRPPAQGRSIPEIAKAATQAAKVRTKMMAYTGDFIFLHGNTRRVVMDDFFWRTCLGSIYVYIYYYLFIYLIYLFIYLFIYSFFL